MARTDRWRNGLQPRVADEVDHIKEAFRNPPRRKGADRPQGKEIVAVPAPDGGIDYMFAEGEILVREEYLDRVLEILGHASRRDLERDEPRPSGLSSRASPCSSPWAPAIRTRSTR